MNAIATYRQLTDEDDIIEADLYISATHTEGSSWEYPRRGGRFAWTSMPVADLLMARWPQRWDRADFGYQAPVLRLVDDRHSCRSVQKEDDSDDR
jgi:hypothetical protein